MKNLKISMIVLFGLMGLCCKKQDIQFIPIHSLDYENEANNGFRTFKNKGKYYIIRGYDGSKDTEKAIDNFVSKNKDKGWQEFDNYKISFYKESSETNLENIQNDSKVIYRYSNENDLVFEYNWSRGGSIGKFKIKNGQIIEPKGHEVILSPAPPLKDSIK
ncbi:hypothetical protein N9R54_03715 [Pelobium sp.]|nr:hypothetical protein [Pelobium sp.]MDA9555321.1 hypothetical protein [Pelobium sp.]